VTATRPRRPKHGAALLLAIAGAAAGALLPASAGGAAPRLTLGAWEPVPDAGRRLLADGERYVVTRSRTSVVRMQDTETGARRRLVEPPCDSGRSLPTAIGGGMLVWECAGLVALGGHVLVVEDLASGRQFLPAGFPEFRKADDGSHDGSVFHAVSVGRSWIYLTRSGYHFADDVLVGIGQAEVMHDPAQRADFAVDPDRASGVRRLCAGIRRHAGLLELGQLPFGVLAFHRPYAITAGGRLRSCAGAPPVPAGPVVAALSATRVSWATKRLLRVRRTAGGPMIRRSAPGTVRSIALTSGFVYVTTGSGTGARVSRGRLRLRR
jgi:hypothetical protein